MFQLLNVLARRDWHHVCATPATHARYVARRRRAETLADALGWSLPFAPGSLDAEVERLLAAAGALDPAADGLCRAAVRVSRLHGHPVSSQRLSDRRS